jgi:hypothetical protein
MKATLLRIEKHPSKFGKEFYYFFFKCADGKSRRSCIYPTYGNFQRWKHLINTVLPIELDNLLMKGNLIDADSYPKTIYESQDTKT